MMQFVNRVVRTLQLDPDVYLEIKENRRTLGQAVILITLSAMATGIGSVGGYVEKIPMAMLTASGAWIIWALFIYVLGARIFPAPDTKTNLSVLIRVIGFASAPGILKSLAFFPAVSGIVAFGATVWILGTTAIATQVVLRYASFPHALGISFSGWILYQWLLFQI